MNNGAISISTVYGCYLETIQESLFFSNEQKILVNKTEPRV